MYDVTIESPIESPMVSPAILNSSGIRVQDLTESTFTLVKPTIYPGPHDLVRQTTVALGVLGMDARAGGEGPMERHSMR